MSIETGEKRGGSKDDSETHRLKEREAKLSEEAEVVKHPEVVEEDNDEFESVTKIARSHLESSQVRDSKDSTSVVAEVLREALNERKSRSERSTVTESEVHIEKSRDESLEDHGKPEVTEEPLKTSLDEAEYERVTEEARQSVKSRIETEESASQRKEVVTEALREAVDERKQRWKKLTDVPKETESDIGDVSIEKAPKTEEIDETSESSMPDSLSEQNKTLRIHEAEVSDEALNHQINPTKIRDVLRKAEVKESLTVEELTEVVEEIYRERMVQEDNRVDYAELCEVDKPINEVRQSEIAKEIHANKEEIERALNERFELHEDSHHEVRVAVTDDRLYYWTKDSSPNRWLNALAGEKLYLRDKHDEIELMNELQRSLGVEGTAKAAEAQLNDIIRQLSHLEQAPANRLNRHQKGHSIEGETLHFISDVLDRDLEDFKPMITHIGRTGQIANPRWPELRKWRVKAVAIGVSDCYLEPGGTLTYTEKDAERRDLAIQHFEAFGDFRAKAASVSKTQEDTKRVRLPRVYGRMMGYWGVSEGDKAIHNKGLAECIVDESLENKTEYLKTVVAEDGTFSRRFGLTRANVLHAGIKAEDYRERYGIEPKVTQEDIDYIVSIASPMSKNLCYEEGDRVRIHVSLLREKSEHGEPHESSMATRILDIIERERNKLLDDEVDHIIKPLGIKMTGHTTYVTYYKNTARLSVEWIEKTSKKEDTIRWALMAPPEHPEKLEKVIRYLRKNMDKVRKVKENIVQDGLSPSTLWEGYGI